MRISVKWICTFRMYDDLKKGEDDNPTIGMILVTDKDETIIKCSVLAEHEKLFASKYRIYLPDEQELKQLIEQDRTLFDLNTNGTNEPPLKIKTAPYEALFK